MSGVQGLSAINSRPTAVIIADQLRESIIDGAFGPGDQINEAQVASQLNVSRGPVREALHRLVQEGLLISRPNRGVFVQDFTLRDIAEVYEAREVIECAAAEIITKMPEAERKHIAATLSSIIERMKAPLAAEDWAQLSRIDLEFHATLVAHSENSRLSRAYSTLATEALISLANGPGSYPDAERIIPGHTEIVEVLTQGDMEELHHILHNHLSISDYQLHTHEDDGSLRHGRNEENPMLRSQV